jgi:hypothetical protein
MCYKIHQNPAVLGAFFQQKAPMKNKRPPKRR